MTTSTEKDTIFELRQYTLYGGRRDELVELFEQQFIGPQNELGLHVVGTFTDMDDPDRFVWLRGFRDMDVRGAALPAFYGGPVWQEHKDDANATMLDSDNVLLLRTLDNSPVAIMSGEQSSGAMYAVTIYNLRGVAAEVFRQFFATEIAPRLAKAGVVPVAVLTTCTEANNFPRLPVREGEQVFLCMARWPSVEAHREFLEECRRWSGWRDRAPVEVLPALMQKPEILRLKPTRRSALQ